MSRSHRKRKTFLNDADGISAKDYLLLVSTVTFFTFLTLALILVLAGRKIDPIYLELLDMATPTLVTIVGGVMGVQAVESFSKTRQTKTSVNQTKTTNEGEYEND